MHPTPYTDLNAALKELTSGIRAALGDNFLAAYLQGSFAVGDFDLHSDVDFVVVVDDELTEKEVPALQAMHGRIFDLDCEWARHLDGSYFPKDVIEDCRARGKPLWYLDNGHRSMVLSDHCNTAVVRWVVRERGVALAGPPPTSLIAPIPVDLLRREIFDVIRDWGQEILAEPERFENRFYQTFIVLSYCRMLHDLIAGTIGSKRTGAEWAKSTLASSWADLIDRTWAGRPNPAVSVRTPPDPQDYARTLEFVRYIIAESERVAVDLGIGKGKNTP